MNLFLTFLDYAVPVLITLLLIVTTVAVYIGGPYIQYIVLVTNADTKEGKENLARYLAYKAGGPKIDVEHTWRSFLPAAKDIHRSHIYKRQHINN